MSEETDPMQDELERAERGLQELRENRKDRWYPEFHIAPAAGWINDPNGLSYFNGRYHVYFQHHPFTARWGPMYWGHVSSEDMVTWRHEPIAMAPSVEEDRNGVWSGSAVVSDSGKLVIYYTGNRWRNGVDDDAGLLQVQCMAVSSDGVAFEKKGVIVDCPEGVLHFRDPKVWRTDGTWFMIFGASSTDRRGQVWLYTSTDMISWDFDRILYEHPDPDVWMLECPDLFPLGDKWVLMYGPMGAKPDGYALRNGYDCGYVVGEWAPGKDFVTVAGYRPLDWGGNYYAPQSFEAPDGRRIVHGWMGSFTIPPASQRDDGWCGQLTVPRTLRLSDDNRVVTNPIEELTRLRRDPCEFGAFELAVNEARVVAEDIAAAEVVVEVDLAATTAGRWGLAVNKTPDGHETIVAFDDLARRVIVDRRHAGAGDRGYRGAPAPEGDEVTLRVLVDKASVEVFVNDGEECVSSLAFPADGPRSIEIYAESGTVKIDSLAVYRLASIYSAR